MAQVTAEPARAQYINRPTAPVSETLSAPIAPAPEETPPAEAAPRSIPTAETSRAARNRSQNDPIARQFENNLQKSGPRAPKDQTFETALQDLEGSTEYKSLSPQNQAKAKQAVSATGLKTLANQRSATLRETMGTEGFKKLSADDQGKVVDLYGKLGMISTMEATGMSKNGRLFAEDNAPEGKKGRTFDHLHQLATGPLAKGRDRTELLDATIRETANPGSITQGTKKTSGVTSVAYSLADHQPAEYTRLVSGLASPEGRVKLANGEALAAEPRKGDDGSGRLASSQLLQPALMEYGNGRSDYDNRSDRSYQHTRLGRQDQGADLGGKGSARVAEAVFNKPYDRVGIKAGAFPPGSIASFDSLSGSAQVVTPVATKDGRFVFRSPQGWQGASDGSVHVGPKVVARQEANSTDRGGKAPLVGLASIPVLEARNPNTFIYAPKED